MATPGLTRVKPVKTKEGCDNNIEEYEGMTYTVREVEKGYAFVKCVTGLNDYSDHTFNIHKHREQMGNHEKHCLCRNRKYIELMERARAMDASITTHIKARRYVQAYKAATSLMKLHLKTQVMSPKCYLRTTYDCYMILMLMGRYQEALQYFKLNQSMYNQLTKDV